MNALGLDTSGSTAPPPPPPERTPDPADENAGGADEGEGSPSGKRGPRVVRDEDVADGEQQVQTPTTPTGPRGAGKKRGGGAGGGGYINPDRVKTGGEQRVSLLSAS